MGFKILRNFCRRSFQHYLIRPGQIARPMSIGRAEARKTSEKQPIFRASTFCLVKIKKINLQVFNRIGKAMKNVQ